MAGSTGYGGRYSVRFINLNNQIPDLLASSSRLGRMLSMARELEWLRRCFWYDTPCVTVVEMDCSFLIQKKKKSLVQVRCYIWIYKLSDSSRFKRHDWESLIVLYPAKISPYHEWPLIASNQGKFREGFGNPHDTHLLTFQSKLKSVHAVCHWFNSLI